MIVSIFKNVSFLMGQTKKENVSFLMRQMEYLRNVVKNIGLSLLIRRVTGN